MAAVAVEGKEAVTRLRFLLCKSIKGLFQPRQPEVILRPPRLRIAKKYPVFFWYDVVYPCTTKFLLSLEDQSWIYLAPICTYTCQNCYPLPAAVRLLVSCLGVMLTETRSACARSMEGWLSSYSLTELVSFPKYPS
jgi:hypothetical protein